MKKGISLLLTVIMLFSVVNVNVFAASVATPKTTSSNDVGGIKVYWNKVDGAVKYNVYRRVGGSSSWVLAGTTTGTQILDRGVSNGKYYAYSVRAYDSKNNYSAYNQKMTYTTKCVFTPILNLLENTTNGLKLTWDAVPGASYRVYRRGAGTSTWTYLGTTSNTSYTDGKAVSGKYWRYTVRAVSSGYYSGFDTNGRYTMRLANPYSIKAKQDYSDGYMTISWAKINGAVEYLVYRRGAGQNWMCIASTNETYYTDNSLLPNQYYRYSVRAIRPKNIISDYYAQGTLVKTYNEKYYDLYEHLEASDECKVYEIYNANDLIRFAKDVNSGIYGISAVLKNNITLSNCNWTPIGITDEKGFMGEFQGNGYTITFSNCTINASNTEYLGLFGWSTGTIADLTVAGNINCTGSGDKYVGGIVGFNIGMMSNCVNKCNVTGDDNVGGITGANNAFIDACVNMGKVTSKGAAAGVAGVNYWIIKDSANKGDVFGQANVGGISGFSDGAEISCTNSGKITGESCVGGITGQVHNRESFGLVENCENTGSVFGSGSYYGGVVGLNRGTVVACVNKGTVTSNGGAGGIVGTNEGEVNSCTNKGTVKAETKLDIFSYLGSLVSENDGGTILNCYCYSGTAAYGVGHCYDHGTNACGRHGITVIV